jgi:hypothetical protein
MRYLTKENESKLRAELTKGGYSEEVLAEGVAFATEISRHLRLNIFNFTAFVLEEKQYETIYKLTTHTASLFHSYYPTNRKRGIHYITFLKAIAMVVFMDKLNKTREVEA